ncbi:C2 domain-containing protein [Coccidioides immitis RS]|uniref:C2 domain-containing protein n=1 Tax=Coccidioides immitis (strain RS) TaxID=246410 RepID=J3K3H1_COCIM|nr:C2 domain-containing protein [Coccidioides immitis RS]EAS28734.3 C2 domain-containing protein [Coccidioides immitis RS]
MASAHHNAVRSRQASHSSASAVEETMDHDSPAGGFDDTPIPDAPPGFTLKFTIHRAQNLPLGDFGSMSSDPYVLLILNTDLARRHPQDPDITFRTPTIRKDINPVWNCEWIVANVPASGFHLKCRVYDEDFADHDDRLGTAYIDVDGIDENWSGFKEQHFKVRKKTGSNRAYLLRSIAATCSKNFSVKGELIVSVECLGKTPGDQGGHMYTIGPNYWTRHFSPMIGRLVGTKDSVQPGTGKKPITKYNFQAIQIQLTGPVPWRLYHRYVEFKPFVAGMFNGQSIRGRLLNHALHHQHARIYNFDRSTMHGMFPSPCIELAQQFLEFVHYDQGGRIFTYVLTLDGQWRFTETGKEFGIDLLSKHTMHSDVSIYIAYSGEFFVRRVHHHHHHHHHNRRHSHKEKAIDSIVPDGGNKQTDAAPNRSQDSVIVSIDPADYELVIDNDSGTYRPNASLLPLLKEFLEKNLPGLKITTLDCQKDAEEMNKLKEEQRERKKATGRHIAYLQRRVSSSSSSISSSDEEELEQRMGQAPKHKNPLAQKLHWMMDPKARYKEWVVTGHVGRSPVAHEHFQSWPMDTQHHPETGEASRPAQPPQPANN